MTKAYADDPIGFPPCVTPPFPALHIRPERGWLNDPNGTCRCDGVYHVFFQYNPAAPLHANVHWGHVSSTDLVRWQEHPVALVPRPGRIDGAGCWSGCVVDDGGIPTAVYTANPDARVAGLGRVGPQRRVPGPVDAVGVPGHRHARSGGRR